MNNIKTFENFENLDELKNSFQKYWVKTNDYYNRDVVTSDVYTHIHTPTIKIYLIDRPYFQYTVSAGANSSFSYTGSFYGHSEIDTVEKAAEAIRQKHPTYFKNPKNI